MTEIHEIDLCYWFFGVPQAVFCVGGNLSYVDLKVEDTVSLTLVYQSLIVTLNICFMHKKTRRELYINGHKKSAQWTEENNLLTLFDHQKNNEEERVSLPFCDSDEIFEKQFESFLALENKFSDYEFTKSKASVLIVNAAKESMKNKKLVNVE